MEARLGREPPQKIVGQCTHRHSLHMLRPRAARSSSLTLSRSRPSTSSRPIARLCQALLSTAMAPCSRLRLRRAPSSVSFLSPRVRSFFSLDAAPIHQQSHPCHLISTRHCYQSRRLRTRSTSFDYWRPPLLTAPIAYAQNPTTPIRHPRHPHSNHCKTTAIRHRQTQAMTLPPPLLLHTAASPVPRSAACFVAPRKS